MKKESLREMFSPCFHTTGKLVCRHTSQILCFRKLKKIVRRSCVQLPLAFGNSKRCQSISNLWVMMLYFIIPSIESDQWVKSPKNVSLLKLQQCSLVNLKQACCCSHCPLSSPGTWILTERTLLLQLLLLSQSFVEPDCSGLVGGSRFGEGTWKGPI